MVKHTRKKGGYIMSKNSADGCVFTRPVWPCASSLEGYDPNDRRIVSKLILKTDMEYETIKIAQSILTKDSPFLLNTLGECTPADKTTIDTETLEQLKAIGIEQENTRRGACYHLEKGSLDDYKILVSRQYSSTLYDFARSYSKASSMVPFYKLLNESGPFLNALNKLASRKNGNSLVNIDLHANNIFVNTFPNNIDYDMEIGIADFGRCFVYIKDASTELNMQTWVINFLIYCDQHQLSSILFVPLEVRLLSFILKPITYKFIKDNIESKTLNLSLWLSFVNYLVVSNVLIKNSDIMHYFLKPMIVGKMSNTYIKIIDHIIKYLEVLRDLINDVDTEYKKEDLKNIYYLVQFLHHRTAGIGYIGSLLREVAQFNRSIDLTIPIETYLETGELTFKDDRYSQLMHVYILELFAPYDNDYSIEELYTNETKNRCYNTYMKHIPRIILEPVEPVEPIEPVEPASKKLKSN